MNPPDKLLLDAGVSGTKGLVLVDGQPQKFLIQPGVTPLPPSLGTGLRLVKPSPQLSEIGAGQVEVNGKTWLVGAKPISALSGLAKRESLIPKVLASSTAKRDSLRDGMYSSQRKTLRFRTRPSIVP